MVVEAINLDTLKKGNILVDFYSTTCGPCKLLNPVLEEVSKEVPDVKVVKVEVTKCPEAAHQYGIQCLPTVMFLQNSKVREVSQGLTTKVKILAMLKKHLAPAM